MPANFRADQPTGAGAGSSGVARDDLWENQVIELHDTSTGMGTSREWILDTMPAGGSATVASPTASPATFTPTVLGKEGGTYKITLRFDGVSNRLLGDGSLNPQYALKNKTFVLRVTKDAAGVAIPELLPLPAFLEEDLHSAGITGQGQAPGKGHSPLLARIRTKLYEMLGWFSKQDVAYGASITVDLSLGSVVHVGALTGAITFDVSNPPLNKIVTVRMPQDGSGNRANAWAAKFKFGTNYSPYAAFEASASTTWKFYAYSATELECVGREEIGSSSVFDITTNAQTLKVDRINRLSAAAVSALLPAAATWAHRSISVTTTGNASVTITPNGAETIAGDASYTITGSGASLNGDAVFTTPGTSPITGWPGQ